MTVRTNMFDKAAARMAQAIDRERSKDLIEQDCMLCEQTFFAEKDQEICPSCRQAQIAMMRLARGNRR